MKACGGGHRGERGAAIVEFTVALPLLLLLLLATAELGRAFFQYNALTKAVRDGSRHLAGNALFGSTGVVFITATLATETVNLVVYGNPVGSGDPLLPGLAPGNVQVNDDGGGYVSVSATWNYTPMLGGQLPTFGLGDPVALGIPLSASVTLRAL